MDGSSVDAESVLYKESQHHPEQSVKKKPTHHVELKAVEEKLREREQYIAKQDQYIEWIKQYQGVIDQLHSKGYINQEGQVLLKNNTPPGLKEFKNLSIAELPSTANLSPQTLFDADANMDGPVPNQQLALKNHQLEPIKQEEQKQILQ